MENVLEIRNLIKDYPGVRAINDVSFDIRKNTVHCLVGENGAAGEIGHIVVNPEEKVACGCGNH